MDLLKIDVEGAELDLLGCVELHVLARVNQLSVEFHKATVLAAWNRCELGRNI